MLPAQGQTYKPMEQNQNQDHNCGQFTFHRDTKIIQWGKNNFSNLGHYLQEANDLDSFPYIKHKNLQL